MLNSRSASAAEEALRAQVAALPDARRKEFYRRLQPLLRDPDNYAVLNWLFPCGLHHFYLGRWLAGLADLALSVLGFALLFTPALLLGWVMLAALALWELANLFRSQLIVQDYNNQQYQALLARLP